RTIGRTSDLRPGDRCILAAGPSSGIASELLNRSGLILPKEIQSLALVATEFSGHDILLCAGSDPTGLAYALLEAIDRVIHDSNPINLFRHGHPLVEKPANPIRSISRLFVSEVEDKPWFYDRSFWDRYLTMLVSNRFNRFQLAFGVGYDFLSEVTDSYLHFSY